MKITIVLPVYWPAVGGCEIHTRELVRRLSAAHSLRVVTLINSQAAKSGMELWFACVLRAPREADRYRDDGAEVVRLPLKSWEKGWLFPLVRMQSPKLPARLTAAAMEELTDRYASGLLPWIEGSDLVHSVHGGVSFLGYAALKAARRLGLPFAYTPVLHLPHPGNGAADGPAKEPELHLSPRGWSDPVWKRLTEEADFLFTMTEFERGFFIRKGRSPETVMAVGVGPMVTPVEPARRSECLRKFELAGRDFVLFVGRNVPYKGIGVVLEAAPLVWERNPEILFVFAGPKEGDADAIFARHRDSRVRVLGYVSDEEKSVLLDACTLFCMPSTQESLGGTFLEAWWFRKPVIGARIGPLEELAGDGEGGFLVRPEPGEVAGRILLLLEAPALRDRMGVWGRQRVESRYTWEAIARTVDSAYRRMVGRNE